MCAFRRHCARTCRAWSVCKRGAALSALFPKDGE